MSGLAIQVGVLGPDDTEQPGLREGLERNGLAVSVQCSLRRFLSDPARQALVQVLLLDLERADDADLDLLDELFDACNVPMVFYDGAGRLQSAAWWRRFAVKIRMAVAAGSSALAADALPGADGPRLPGQQVWVLGASFGGPEALKRFLSVLPQQTPAALIVAQHIGRGFVEVLAGQLNRACNLRVAAANDGDQLRDGQVLVAPVSADLCVDSDGRIRFQPCETETYHRPSIDEIMAAVAARYGANAGGIVFSGMGYDGMAGCRALAAVGGTVWAQDSASCAIDSMPNCAAETGVVTYRAPPEALAAALVDRLTERAVDLPVVSPPVRTNETTGQEQ